MPKHILRKQNEGKVYPAPLLEKQYYNKNESLSLKRVPNVLKANAHLSC